MAHDVMTDVNVGSERELVAALSTVPQLSVYAAQRIVQLRPFRDRDDMLNRVNAGCPVLRNRLSGKTAKHFTVGLFHSARKRDAAHGREIVGLCVRVPWSAWGGEYADSTDVETGVVVEYQTKVTPEEFVVEFPQEAECERIGLTWAQLLGEVDCHCGGRAEVMWRGELPLTLRPAGKLPLDHYWDMREGAWFHKLTSQRRSELRVCEG